MPLRKHNKNQRPSASRSTRTGGRSRRTQGQTQPSLSAEEMRERAEAYARMHRGGEESQQHANNVSQPQQPQQPQQPHMEYQVPHVSVQPAQKQPTQRQFAQKQPVQKQPAQRKIDVPSLAAMESAAATPLSAEPSPETPSSTEEPSVPQTAQTKERSSKAKVRASRPKRKDSTKQRRFKPLFVVLAILAAILLVATSVLAWNQWLRFDDKADIQGTWYVDGTDSSITITDTQIVLTDSVAYDYTLDTFNKTITFSFSNLQGRGTYAFSPERDALIITEQDSSAENGSVPTKLVRTSASEQATQQAESAEATQQAGSAEATQQAGSAEAASTGTTQ